MALEPKFDFVLLERETMQKKHSSIIIPEMAEKRNAPAIGRVVACGPGVDATVQPDTTVLFGKHAGDWIEHDGGEFYVVKDIDILCEVTR